MCALQRVASELVDLVVTFHRQPGEYQWLLDLTLQWCPESVRPELQNVIRELMERKKEQTPHGALITGRERATGLNILQNLDLS